jgi:hypothetical protein
MSINSEALAEARQRAAAGLGHYNVKVGNTTLAFTSGLGFNYTDNPFLVSHSTNADVYVEPHMGVRVRSPVTERNSLDLALEVGYLMYVRSHQLDRLYITPVSELSFDMKVGKVLIDLHERPSITQYSYQDPTLSSQADFGVFRNTLGANGLCDLNKLVLRAGYDHVNYIYQNTGAQIPDTQMDLFYLSGGYRPTATRAVGLELGLGLIGYDRSTVTNGPQNATQSSLGVFYKERLTTHLDLSLHGGYTVFAVGATTTPAGTRRNDESGFYVSALLNHQIHERFSYSLSGGQQVQLALLGGNYTITSVRWDGHWHFLRKTELHPYLGYERWSQVDPLLGVGDQFDRVLVGLSLARDITQKLRGALSFDHIEKKDVLPALNYVLNIFSLSLEYRF